LGGKIMASSKFIEGKIHTIASNKLKEGIGKVNILNTGKDLSITVLFHAGLSSDNSEGWTTCVGLDSSISMLPEYGFELIGELPENVMQDYISKNLAFKADVDGISTCIIQKSGVEEAIKKGYFKYSENNIEKSTKRFIKYLAENFDMRGKTTLFYCSCGENGDEIDVVGDLKPADVEDAEFKGPKNKKYGAKSQLLPSLKFIVENYNKSSKLLILFFTDGNFEDHKELKNYSKQLALMLDKDKKRLVKCVLMGLGKEINENNMEELDNLDPGVNVDIWDHKIISEIRNEDEIFAEVEVIDESRIICPIAKVFDNNKNLIKKFTDGMPVKINFNLPANCDSFEIEIGENKINQPLY